MMTKRWMMFIWSWKSCLSISMKTTTKMKWMKTMKTKVRIERLYLIAAQILVVVVKEDVILVVPVVQVDPVDPVAPVGLVKEAVAAVAVA